MPPLPTVTHDPVPVDHGDFVDSDHEADIEAESEDAMQYLNGHFYPVRIGDILKQRYQVVHKLGRGGFSTVWLAHDEESGKDVALKISTSTEHAAKEYEVHQDILHKVQDRSRLILCQDKFLLNRVDCNINYKYTVLVLPLQGPSFLTLQREKETKRPLANRMSAAKQLLQAILSLHNAGLVHRGKAHQFPILYSLLNVLLDIVLPNIICGLNIDLGPMSIADKYKLLGRPRKARALEEDEQIVGELVAPASFPPEILGSDAFLCDFGILIQAGTSVPNKLQSPPGYCAPELFHNIEPSFASDMWSFMVVFLYLYTEHPVFTGWGFAGIVSSIVKHIGALPIEWKGCYNAYDKEEVQESWYSQGLQSGDTFDAFLDKYRPDINADEKALLLSVIQQVFRPRPEDRATAYEILSSEDFQALMDIYGV